MNILVTGFDGYEGFPLCVRLLKEGHTVIGIDNEIRRHRVKNIGSCSAIPIGSIESRIKQLKKLDKFTAYLNDLSKDAIMSDIFIDHKIDTVIHLASQPSAPYSMLKRHTTLRTNFENTLNLIDTFNSHRPKGHFIFISTMGEYGTPNIEIPEGFAKVKGEITHKDNMPFQKWETIPASRDPGSWYHLSKVMSTQSLYLFHKLTNMKISVIMQGVVYGTRITEMDPEHKTRFDFDKYFGTVLNRFVAQSIIGESMTIYGSGNQKRGMLHLQDAINGIMRSVYNVGSGFKIRNQNSFLTSIHDLALSIQKVGEDVLGFTPHIKSIENPRKETDYHLYKVSGTFSDNDKFNLDKNLKEMFEELKHHKELILENKDSM